MAHCGGCEEENKMNETYHNFDLSIEHTEEGDFIRVVNSPAGIAVIPFIWPFDPQELTHFAAELGDQTRDNQAITQAYGMQLFQTIFQGEVGQRFQESIHQVYQRRERLRVRLHLSQLPGLANLPWEYLYNPIQNEFYSLATHTPLIRYVNLMQHLSPLDVGPPLRMLVVVADPDGYPYRDAEREWLLLADALDYLALEGLLIIERLRRPTLFNLQQRLRQAEYHILHVIGHTQFSRADGDGQLVLEDEMGRGRLISGQHLGTLLHDHYSLRLALLQSCTNARRPMEDALAYIAQHLVLRGLPAAISVPYSLSDRADVAFVQEIYGALCHNEPIDFAITAARQSIQEFTDGVEWGIPALVTRSEDGKLFNVRGV